MIQKNNPLTTSRLAGWLLCSFFSSLFFSSVLSAQAQNKQQGSTILKGDTLQSVTIQGFSEREFAYGAVFIEIDSTLRKLYPNDRLNELLQRSSSLYVKDYGSSRIASTGIRGTGAEHTQIQWNGLPINSPTLGMSDLAVLPSGIADRLQINTGSGSALFGSGAIGGVIQLESLPTGQESPSVQLDQGLGSFRWRQTTLQIRYGKGAWEGRSMAYYHETDNNFPIRLPNGNQSRTQDNARVRLLGAVQDLYWQQNTWSANIHAWYYSSDRQLPPPLSRPRDDDRQWDRGLRLIGEVGKQYHWGSTSIKTGFLKDAIHFKDFDLTDALTSTQQWIGEVQQQIKLKSNMQLLAGIRGTGSNAISPSLPPLWEWRLAAFALYRASLSTVRISAQVRQEWLEGYDPALTPTFGFEWDILKKEKVTLALQGQVSQGYRIPTLNHRYWEPGGNPDIRPESSQNYEIGLELQRETKRGKLQATLQTFHMLVDEWIYWRPQPEGYWSPENVQVVKNRGIEFQVQQTWQKIHWGCQYTWTLGTILKDPNSNLEGESLFYVPEHKGNLWVSRELGDGWSANLNTQYTGERFDISRLRLKPFSTFDVSIRWDIQDPEWKGISWQLRIDNLFNANYQNVINYPMPGRSWKLMLLVKMG